MHRSRVVLAKYGVVLAEALIFHSIINPDTIYSVIVGLFVLLEPKTPIINPNTIYSVLLEPKTPTTFDFFFGILGVIT